MYNCSGVSFYSSQVKGVVEGMICAGIYYLALTMHVKHGQVCYQTGTVAFYVLSIKMQRFDVVKTWILVLYS